MKTEFGPGSAWALFAWALASIFVQGALIAEKVVTFDRMGTIIGRAYDVSADGSVVVGVYTEYGSDQAFRWEDGVLASLDGFPLGYGAASRAYAVSADGSVVVGERITTEGPEAFRWADGVMTGLGDLPGGGFSSSAKGVSADGSVVVGRSESEDGTQAFRWEDGVMSGLVRKYAGASSVAHDISADGSIIVGQSMGWASGNPVRWENGIVDRSIDLWPGWTDLNWPASVSSNGSVMVGTVGFPMEPEAFRLEAGSGIGWESQIPFCRASDVNGDGSMIVGSWIPQDAENDGSDDRAVYWSEDDGWSMVLLNDLLDTHGIDRGGFELIEATAISADGTTIVGYGWNSEDASEQAYRVRILPAGTETWGPYEITDGYCDTTPWMGWMAVDNAPWVWCVGTNCWYYISDACAEAGEGWIYSTDLSKLDSYMVPSTNWGWSFKLSKWVYVHGGATSGQGWVYVP